MGNKIIGYKRGSQRYIDLQLHGIDLDLVYVDLENGTHSDRDSLNRLIKECKSGDKVIISSMDRLSRDLNKFFDLMKIFTEKNVSLEFINENTIYAGTKSSEKSQNFFHTFKMFSKSRLNMVNDTEDKKG